METKEKRNTGLVVVIILLVVALLGSVGYIVYDKILSKDKESVNVNNIKDNENKQTTKITEEDKNYAKEYVKNKKYHVLQKGINNNNVITLTDSSKLQISIENIISNMKKIGIRVPFPKSNEYGFIIVKSAVDENLKISFVNPIVSDYFSVDKDTAPYGIKYIEKTESNLGSYQIAEVPFGFEGPDYNLKTEFYDKIETNNEYIYVYYKLGYYTFNSKFEVYSDKEQKNKVYSKSIDCSTPESEMKDYESINVNEYKDKLNTYKFIFKKSKNNLLFDKAEIIK